MDIEKLTGRPLLDTKPDHELFAGRANELSRSITSAERRQNVLVTGERGVGKTSLLRQVLYELRLRHPDEPPPIFVEGHLADDTKSFLDLVRYRFGMEPLARAPSPPESALSMTRRGGAVLPDTLQLPTLVAGLRDATAEKERIVLVDELPSASVGQTIFGRLRDELWQLPIAWIVAIPDEWAGSLLTPPADAFFQAIVQIPALSRDEQARLLVARAGEDGRRLAAMLDEGNPRRLIALARVAWEHELDPGGLSRAQSIRDARVSELGRPAAMLVAELEALGPSSASDEALLKRLGWTRNRATQVFRQLEEAGIVTSSPSKTGETGRPRKLYRLVDPSGALQAPP